MVLSLKPDGLNLKSKFLQVESALKPLLNVMRNEWEKKYTKILNVPKNEKLLHTVVFGLCNNKDSAF